MREYSQETINRIHNLYSIIANKQLGNSPESVNIRVNIIRELERLTKDQFASTTEFHCKITGILIQRNKANREIADAE